MWPQRRTRESRVERDDRDNSLPHRSPTWRRSRSPTGRSRSPPQRRSRSRSPPRRATHNTVSPPRRADDLRPPISWEAQLQQRRAASTVGASSVQPARWAPPTSTVPCRFFGSVAGCRRQNCHFRHADSGQQLQQQQQQQLQQPQGMPHQLLPPPQPVRQLPRAPLPQPMGQPQHRPPLSARLDVRVPERPCAPRLPVASAAHQASSLLRMAQH